eukprot:GGOE01014261.1.p1 GENE.GGOE01014261.1~~GGOE01014261.1.p1  ORF type:complete len:357 (+),score=77.27 GGOE01014261.1:81-1151(+)
MEWAENEACDLFHLLHKGISAVCLGHQIYVCGATARSANCRTRDPMEVLVLDTKTGKGEPLETTGPCPSALFAHSAVLHLNLLVLFGGQSVSTNLRTNSTYGLDLASRAWIGLVLQGEFPRNRAYHTAITDGEFMYVFGGRDSNTEGFNDLCCLHLASMSWEALEGWGQVPPPRYAHGCAFHRGSMLVYGGCSRGKFLNDLHRYDTETNIWTHIEIGEGPSQPIEFPACYVLFSELLIMGNGGCLSVDLLHGSWHAGDDLTKVNGAPLVLTMPVLVSFQSQLHLLDKGVWATAQICERSWRPELHAAFPRAYRNIVRSFLSCSLQLGVLLDELLLSTIFSFIPTHHTFGSVPLPNP